ncbi:DUF982 domain-containing protein [Aminobacter sp. AP02]|uniref:DUF982 domain-containing protein n=1 Tax=Aminobacter sp. AP02 TaxID=2135737 RepID=UPI000D6BDC08|nr:DUF982 domain-containing protein [Aminobacter sp. AP02]PWK69892.1 uncharacterized protein DUF982 [Aminobacter sp. AP02]
MEAKAFNRPLFVKHEHIVREICCLTDAIAFLTDWPESRRGPIYSVATRACVAARNGQLPVEGARSAVQSFARSANILEQGPISLEPWMMTTKRGRGGLPA